jgi:mannose-6-phosphate isomerase-like protein (cupin superfamily)
MRTGAFAPIFVSWLCLAAMSAGPVRAQAPPAQPPAQPQQRPARPAAAAAATPTITVQVTNSSGLPLANVQVTAQGPVSRDGETGEDGSLRFANMRPGAYRLRFTREGSTTLDRDILVRAGEPLLVDVALSAAPAAPKPVEPPPVAAPARAADKPLGPPADPKLTPIPTFLEKNFIGREGRKDSPLGCTSTGAATLVQLREALLNQTHDEADEWIYVVAGEGTLRLGTAEQHLQAGTFSLIPHAVAHGLLPGGRNPLVFVSVLSGYKAC